MKLYSRPTGVRGKKEEEEEREGKKIRMFRMNPIKGNSICFAFSFVRHTKFWATIHLR